MSASTGKGSKHWLEVLIDALYRDFLLRDLFAKIVPGALVLLTAIGALDPSSPAAQPLRKPEVVHLVLFAGIAWLTGFAVQSIGEFCWLMRQWPGRYDEAAERYAKRIEFKRVADESNLRRVERYAIIKEATGNGGTAMLLAALIAAARSLLSGSFSISPQLHFLLGLQLLFAAALLRANRAHAEKQYRYIEKVLGRP